MITEDDLIRDEAEQALSDHYDRNISIFYEDAFEKAKAVRQVFDENRIEKLFDENG